MAVRWGHAWLLLPLFSDTVRPTLPGVLLSADELPGIPAGLPSGSEGTPPSGALLSVKTLDRESLP